MIYAPQRNPPVRRGLTDARSSRAGATAPRPTRLNDPRSTGRR